MHLYNRTLKVRVMSNNEKQNEETVLSSEKLKNSTKHNLTSSFDDENVIESPEKTHSKRFKHVTPTKAVDIANTTTISNIVEDKLPSWVAGLFYIFFIFIILKKK